MVDLALQFLIAGLQNPLLTSRLAAVFGPGATLWYKFLQKRIVLKSENATIAARVLVDQSVFASTNLFLFLSSMAYMEGTDPKEKLNSTYFNALQKNWMVWPAVQAINFKLVPLEHRVLVVNIVSLGECFFTHGPAWPGIGSKSDRFRWSANVIRTGWNCYLSYINSKKD